MSMAVTFYCIVKIRVRTLRSGFHWSTNTSTRLNKNKRHFKRKALPDVFLLCSRLCFILAHNENQANILIFVTTDNIKCYYHLFHNNHSKKKN